MGAPKLPLLRPPIDTQILLCLGIVYRHTRTHQTRRQLTLTRAFACGRVHVHPVHVRLVLLHPGAAAAAVHPAAILTPTPHHPSTIPAARPD